MLKELHAKKTRHTHLPRVQGSVHEPGGGGASQAGNVVDAEDQEGGETVTPLDDIWKENPTVYYSESGERFGTPYEMMAEIRRLRLALALATSRVTPWQDRIWGSEWTAIEAVCVVHQLPRQIRLGDGTPEEQP